MIGDVLEDWEGEVWCAGVRSVAWLHVMVYAPEDGLG
jgi:hypothetical protein